MDDQHRDTVIAETAAVELIGIRKQFGDVTALSEFDLTLGHGETVALLGPNGAGKTTAIGCLLGWIRPDAGSVRLLGASPRDPRVRARVGCQLQQTSFYPLIRVEEALELFGSYYPRRRSADDLIATFGLRERRGATFQRLSGGERQRLALALAFVGDPELLVLDEPSTALDVAGRQLLWRMIGDFRAAGRSVLLATHSLEEAEAVATHVVIVHRGRVVASGRPRDLVAVHGGTERLELSLSGDGAKGHAVLYDLRSHLFVDVTPRAAIVWGKPRDELVRLVLETVSRHGASVSELRLRKSSLEEILLDLTGEEAER